MNRKSILLIVQNNSFPFDKRIYKEAISLKKDGYNVYVISPRSNHDKEKKTNFEGIEVFRYKDYESTGSIFGFLYEYLNAIVKISFFSTYLILKRKIKIFHAANPPDFFWPLFIFFKLFGVKSIYDQHDLAPEMYRLKFGKGLLYKFLNLNEGLSIKYANSIIVVNNSFKKRLENTWRLNNKDITIIPNGPMKNFVPFENKNLNKKYAGKKIILYVGLMTVNDNIEVIIETANKIINDFEKKNCFFILLGDGDVRSKMEVLVKNYGLTEYVEFAGIVEYSKVMEYLYIADVCIAPDQPNGLNEHLTLIKVLEYMKAKKPFVAFELAETKAMAKDSGLYAIDINDYAEKILYLIENSDLAAKLGVKGQDIIESEFLWEHSEIKLLELYNKLLNNYEF